MRPPRVVVLFRGDDNWRSWVRLALRAVSSTWGGAGHLLVPYDEAGAVHPELVAAVKTYDPDHVVVLEPTISEREEVEPGLLRIAGEDGKPLQGTPRDEVIMSSGSLTIHDPAGDRARDKLAAVCTTFVEEYDGHRISRVQNTDSAGAGLPGPAASDVVGVHGGTYLAVPKGWTSDVALTVAATIGFEPDPTRSRPAPDQLPSRARPTC